MELEINTTELDTLVNRMEVVKIMYLQQAEALHELMVNLERVKFDCNTSAMAYDQVFKECEHMKKEKGSLSFDRFKIIHNTHIHNQLIKPDLFGDIKEFNNKVIDIGTVHSERMKEIAV